MPVSIRIKDDWGSAHTSYDINDLVNADFRISYYPINSSNAHKCERFARWPFCLVAYHAKSKQLAVLIRAVTLPDSNTRFFRAYGEDVFLMENRDWLTEGLLIPASIIEATIQSQIPFWGR